jgi:hypothetical protein
MSFCGSIDPIQESAQGLGVFLRWRQNRVEPGTNRPSQQDWLERPLTFLRQTPGIKMRLLLLGSAVPLRHEEGVVYGSVLSL